MIKKRIFTFWEPQTFIPPYLQLCMETWKKFLPDYEIIVLDYSNLDAWLDKDFYPEVLYKHFSLPIQADAIRCAILKKYGGIWMDVDTIITSSDFNKLFKPQTEFSLINKYIAFIAAFPNTTILTYWQKKFSRI